MLAELADEPRRAGEDGGRVELAGEEGASDSSEAEESGVAGMGGEL